jgi:hypothetical protein
LPWAVCGVFVAAVLVGALAVATGTNLGTSTPPFVMAWQPKLDRHAWVSLAVIAGALAVAPAIVTSEPYRAAFVAAVLYVLALALGLSVNLGHEGVRGWWAMLDGGPHGSFEGRFEYLGGLGLLDHGVGSYLRNFAADYPWMSTHIKGNPPGPLIALHLLGIRTAGAMAALCVGLGALCAPLAYAIGRELGSEQRGRIAGLLTACSPAIILFGVTSADYAFAGLAMLAAWLLLGTRSRARLAAGGAVVALGSFCSWLLFAIPAWAALAVWQRAGWRSGRREAARVALVAVAAVVALNGALALATGYNPLSALHALSSAYGHGVARSRPYAYWLVGSPAAWAVMLGLPIAFLSLRALVTRRDPAALALWAIIAVAAALGLTKAETERIWLPFAPLACVAAAAAVPPSRLRPVLGLLLCQALAIELLFFTIW